MKSVLGASRYLILVAVLGSFVAATVLFGYGAVRIGQLTVEAVAGPASAKGFKALSLGFIEAVDGFLLATVFYIVAISLYELFVDDTVTLPAWLVVRGLEDLKNKLAGVVAVVLGVLFLGQAVSWDGQRDLLGCGAAVALVIAALTLFLSQRAKKEG
jgi:uncharacterized membrane protein YqhA